MAAGLEGPSCREVALWLRAGPAGRGERLAAPMAGLFRIAPELEAVHGLAVRFGVMVRDRQPESSELEGAAASTLRSFADGLRQDLAAVRAVLSEPWSNGQVEGQVCRLKLVEFSIYRRAKLDLLRARLVAA